MFHLFPSHHIAKNVERLFLMSFMSDTFVHAPFRYFFIHITLVIYVVNLVTTLSWRRNEEVVGIRRT